MHKEDSSGSKILLTVLVAIRQRLSWRICGDWPKVISIETERATEGSLEGNQKKAKELGAGGSLLRGVLLEGP